MWPSMGGFIPGESPLGSSQEKEGPSLASWEDLPDGVLASGPRRTQWTKGRHEDHPCQKRTESEGIFAELQPLLYQPGSESALSSISEGIVFHILLVFPKIAVWFIFHRWRAIGDVCISVIKTWTYGSIAIGLFSPFELHENSRDCVLFSLMLGASGDFTVCEVSIGTTNIGRCYWLAEMRVWFHN
ncbi:hypothetical protein H1C71_004293 [Ictidomys tridecemlineatus]|nr:hypothetical protein H1C71_004293 [Ictidomys tridecemlineatus]